MNCELKKNPRRASFSSLPSRDHRISESDESQCEEKKEREREKECGRAIDHSFVLFPEEQPQQQAPSGSQTQDFSAIAAAGLIRKRTEKSRGLAATGRPIG